MSEEKASLLGLRPLGALAGDAYAGRDPMRMGLGPVFAMAKLQDESGLNPTSADIIEINEAFAVQLLAVLRCARHTPGICASISIAIARLAKSPPRNST